MSGQYGPARAVPCPGGPLGARVARPGRGPLLEAPPVRRGPAAAAWARYGTTVTGHRPAFTNRIATEPMMRCPACSDAPTTTASAFSSSAARTRPL